MKKLLFSLLILLATTAVWAQAPQRLSYQSIIRDGSNVVVASTAVGIKISVVKGTATGPAVYVETHRKTTNANGLVSLEIGEGTALTGRFVDIDWSNGPYLIKTETDPTGGTNYSISGIAPLNSVPYALFAANGTPGPKGDKGDTGATGETGPTGATGVAGPAGTNGLDGKTVLNGTVNPIGQGVDGDFYINTTSNMIFGPKTSGVWPSGVSIVGPTGATGAIGPQGIQGVAGTNGVDGLAGTNGTNGTNGLDGKTILNGTTNPSSQGVDGDFYINTTSNTIFGPKASGAWPSGVSLIGIASIGTISGTSTANGATITSGELNLAPADGTNGGIVTTGVQTFAGAKTFSSDMTVNAITIGKGAGNIDENTAIGSQALLSNTTGDDNTAIGFEALLNNTSGGGNTAIGMSALNLNTTGTRNTATGSNALQNNTEGEYNTAHGRAALRFNTTGDYNTAVGFQAFSQNTTGSNNTAIGYQTSMVDGISNATAIGSGAVVYSSNTIQLGADGTNGTIAITNVKTSGTLTAGAVTYPNTVGSNGQVLTTDGLGAASWASAPTYSIGLNPALGGYVFYVTPDGKHGLVAETIDQLGAADFPLTSSIGPYGLAQDNLANPAKHSTYGANFSDWRIPSRYELLLMYNTIGPGATGANQNIGNFDASRSYLTSTFYDYRTLQYVDFSTGNSERYFIYPFSFLSDKESLRAVRSF